MSQKRASDGTFSSSVSDEDILFFFRTGGRPFYAANEVADEFDLSHTQAKRRLESLADEGELHEIELSDRHTAWWLDRDLVALRAEDGGYSAHDTTTGVASGGESRAEALRSLAEAIEAHEHTFDKRMELGTADGADSSDAPPF